MKKEQFRKGQVFGKWTLDAYLGGGGNGTVWRCLTKEGEEGAIKILKQVNPKSYSRFLDETSVLDKNSDVIGIIPILDRYLPDDIKGKVPFFVMPVAKNAEKEFINKSFEEKIDAILEVCETLKVLHQRGISHRDIKPSNLLYYNSRFSLADFGLVDFPDKRDVSVANEQIGARWTIAPEMKRESSKAEGIKADIYSLAKTLWIVLTGNYKGFEGRYSTESIIELKKFNTDIYTNPIDKLLSACTDNDPNARPNIDEFSIELNNWKAINEDFHKRNLAQWFEIQTKLFPSGFPTRVIWESIDDIINILKIVCSYKDLNHMFFPDGGGMDLEDVRLSNEEGCIELDYQFIEVIKPKRLIFESFNYNPEWNYFRLELDELMPLNLDGRLKREDIREEVSEIHPGIYDRYEIVENRYEYSEYGRSIPESARHVTRWLRGSFVLFNKRSPYNMDNTTYDGRHNEKDSKDFREYIQNNLNLYKRIVSRPDFKDMDDEFKEYWRYRFMDI
ncbi:protein kinase domain-containing protein [Spirosoma aerophilum]